MKFKKVKLLDSPNGILGELEFETDEGKEFYFFLTHLGFMYFGEFRVNGELVNIKRFWEELEKASKETKNPLDKIYLNSIAQRIKLWYVENKDDFEGNKLSNSS